MVKRESWDEYFMLMACQVRTRATCLRRQVGCVLIDSNKRVKGTGYNGAPPTRPHCLDAGCDMVEGTCRRTIHAEANAIGQTLRSDRLGGAIYTTDFPCPNCADSIAASGLVEVVYMIDYHTGKAESIEHMNYYGVQVRQFTPNTLLIEG